MQHEYQQEYQHQQHHNFGGEAGNYVAEPENYTGDPVKYETYPPSLAQLQQQSRVSQEGGGVKYVCDVSGCKQEFTHAKNFKSHLTKHTTIKPFSCLICGESLKRRGDSMFLYI